MLLFLTEIVRNVPYVDMCGCRGQMKFGTLYVTQKEAGSLCEKPLLGTASMGSTGRHMGCKTGQWG